VCFWKREKEDESGNGTAMDGMRRITSPLTSLPHSIIEAEEVAQGSPVYGGDAEGRVPRAFEDVEENAKEQ